MLGSRYKDVEVYQPVRSAAGSGGFTNRYEYVATVAGRMWPASATQKIAAQQSKVAITHNARLWNGTVNAIGAGYVDSDEGAIGAITEGWVLKVRGKTYRVATAMPDTEHDTHWLTLAVNLDRTIEL